MAKPRDYNFDFMPPQMREELYNRHREITRLEQEQEQLGTSVPQMYGSIGKFIANPSTVSVETYKRMLDTDETIGSGIDFLNLCMTARFGDYKHPSEEITQFVRQVLGQVNAESGGWFGALEEMFSAEWAGFSGTEMVWDYDRDFAGGPAFLPKRLVTYQPLTLVFACDWKGSLLPDGVHQYQRAYSNYFGSQFAPSLGGGSDGFRPDMNASVGDLPYPIRVSADLSYLTVPIPTAKMILLRSSVTGAFQNPYGRSILRRCYKNWVLKDAFLKMWLVGADRKGTPLIVGYAGANETVLERGGGGEVQEERSDVAMSRIFKTIHNSSFITLPGKKGEVYEIEAVQVQGDMNVFKDGVDYFNRALMRGLLIPPLIMGGDGGGSFALGQEHHKIFGKIVDGKLKPYKQGICNQFIRKILAYNFPKSAWEKDGYGEFQLEEFDPEIMTQLASVFTQLTTDGYMSPEMQADVDHVRQKMGLPKGKALAVMQTAEPGPEFAGDDEKDPGKDQGKLPAEAADEEELPEDFKV